MSESSGPEGPRIDVSEWELACEDPQGLEKHPWLRHSSRDRSWLFNETDVQANRPLTDDVVEQMASEIAHAIGVPGARVDRVTRRLKRRCIVETLRPSKWDIYAGQVLLGAIVDDYDSKDPEHKGHRLIVIRQALDGFGPPPAFPAVSGLTAFEVFATCAC